MINYPSKELIKHLLSRVCPDDEPLSIDERATLRSYAIAAAELMYVRGVDISAADEGLTVTTLGTTTPVETPFAPQRLSSHREFFDACRHEAQTTKSIRFTLVGPTFLEPDWWHERYLAAGNAPDFTMTVRDRILNRSPSFERCEAILRNNHERYSANLREFVSGKSEWARLIKNMMAGSKEIFGNRGEKGPRIRCFDPGYTHLPHIFDSAVLIGTRGSPQERVTGGWRIRDRSFIKLERERWESMFERQQTQQEAVERLREFLASLRNLG